MIGYRLYPIGDKHVGQLLRRLAIQRIDDATLALLLDNIADDTFDGLILLYLGLDLIVEIAAVERRNENVGLPQSQILYNIAFYLGGSGGCQGDYRDVWVDLVHHLPQPAVFRAEIMTPLRDTMCFINGEKRDLQITEEFHILLLGKRLGCNIQHFGMTIEQILMDFLYLFLV